LVGIAGIEGFESSSDPHPQSPHSQVGASGLQEHFNANVGFDEQQLVSSCSGLEQQLASTTDSLTSHVHSDPELNTNDCKPIAAVANTNSAANNERRISDLIFMVLLPAQMIEGRGDQVKASRRSFKYTPSRRYCSLQITSFCPIPRDDLQILRLGSLLNWWK